jgi:poly-gamma-glutamate capsule biosynthesis protein CapA/YwtB (metallophosphatase superfamily)
MSSIDKQQSKTLTADKTGSAILLGVGDLILDCENAESLFTLAKPVLKAADVVVGQLEFPFTSKGVITGVDVITNLPCDPANLSALPYAGFHVLTFMSNHLWDAGIPGIEDTINGLRDYDIAVVGAGMNIVEARKPVIITRNGVRFGFLAYNCVGPKAAWAAPDKPGFAYVHTISHYEMESCNAGGPPAVYTFCEPRTLKAMVEDIMALRPSCDVLVVSLHKGTVCVPVQIAMYEQQVSYAAIDAGADLILGTHSHILKGIELYKGKTIFHNLGNFVTKLRAPVIGGQTITLKEAAKKGGAIFGYEPDSNDDSWLFHPEGKMTIIAKCTVENNKITKVGYIPCLINKKKQPEILKHDKRGKRIFNYIDEITKGADLNARFKWEGDEVTIY